jgi:hypothetical protein
MLGPVQVLVVGVPDDQGARAVVQSLANVRGDGPVRCLDCFDVTADGNGELVVETPGSGSGPWSLQLFAETGEDPANVSSTGETWHLGDVVPPGSRAVIVLLEHRWASGLRDSMLSAGAALQFETWLHDEDRARLESLLPDHTD